MKINDLNALSEGLQYHVSNNLPLSENIFRPGSEEFFRLIDEARAAFNQGNLKLDWFDQELLNTDIGTIVELASGEEVPLDIPFYEDEQLDEAIPYTGKSPQYKGTRIPTDNTADAKDITKKSKKVDMPVDAIDDFDFSNVDKEKLKKVVADQIATISNEKTRKVIQARFGLGPFKKEYTLDQIAKAMGVSTNTVRQREQKGLRMLKHPSRSRDLRTFAFEAQLDEAVPVAVVWIIKWAIRYGAWPILKWLLKKHGGKIFGGAAIAYYINQGWEWVEGAIGAEYAQMLIDNGFEIGMAVTFILGAVALKRIIERQGARLLFKVNEALIENEELVNEIWGFAAGRSKKREPFKKVPEPKDISVRDRIAARRKAAHKGDKNAWKADSALAVNEASNTGTYRDEENNIDVKWQKLSNGSNEYFDIEAYKDGKRVEINNQQADHYIYMIKQDMDESVNEAEYQGKTVTLNTPKRGGSKKFYVYTKNKKGNVIKVSFGQQGMTVKTDNPGRVKAFVDRHDCKNKNDRTKAGYWSCRLPRYKSLGIKGGQWW